ncbi:hypothetical protein [Lysinibacillus sp. TE18511]
MIDNAKLMEIKQRMEKATRGPWYAKWVNGKLALYTCGLSAPIRLDGTANSNDNYKFIAHAREDIPMLVAEVERLRKALTNIELTTESNVYHGITVEATMRNRAHKELHGVEPEVLANE